MRGIFLSFFAALLVSGPTLAADAPVVPGPGPQQLIEKVSQDLLREIDANRAALNADPAKLRELVDRVVLPSFDADYSARLVLGKYWRTATAAAAPALRRRIHPVDDAQVWQCVA